ncbi:ChbG/HpnK family deacetylase [bacterium]|nr:ChbG/HpnK family deacetylase [bacterium]
MNKNLTSSLLGFPPDARLVIINADDFGMCHSINTALIGALKEGVVHSTSLMVVCPWALHAMHFLKDHPEIPFGIHLTIISDPTDYRWGPITSRDKVPTLVDASGYFYNFDAQPVLRTQAKLGQLELEFRAQIETVLVAGLKPTHLDWHALRFGDRMDILDLMIRLAMEYGLAMRVIGQETIEKLQNQGYPTIDDSFLDSYGLDPNSKFEHYAQLLHELPAGLSEWAVHPGIDNAELLVLEPANQHQRQTDFDYWTSHMAKEIIREEGIILVDYRGLQDVWRRLQPSEKLF